MKHAIASCLLFGATACGGTHPASPGGSAPGNLATQPSKGTTMTGEISPAGDKHPGHITYHDKVEHRTWTEKASDAPSEIAWAKIDGTWKPVVEIEITGAGNIREMTSFGPNHEFLETTMSQLGGTPSEPAPPTR